MLGNPFYEGLEDVNERRAKVRLASYSRHLVQFNATGFTGSSEQRGTIDAGYSSLQLLATLSDSRAIVDTEIITYVEKTKAALDSQSLQ